MKASETRRESETSNESGTDVLVFSSRMVSTFPSMSQVDCALRPAMPSLLVPP